MKAKIVNKGRGKFKILNDEYGGRYIDKIVVLLFIFLTMLMY
jgi:hypothetical protein